MKDFVNHKGFKKGIIDGLPIGLGYLSVSFAFGVQASLLGIPVLISIFISMTNLTSAGQLAGITIIAGAGTFIEIILTQLVINSRYFIMSLSLSQKTDENFTIKKRFIASFGITDEIFGVAISKKGRISYGYFSGLTILPYVGWTLGTVLGAIAGNILPMIVTGSLGIALYSMFIAIFIPPALKNKGIILVVVIAVALSCGFYFIPFLKGISTGFATVICALIASIIVALIFPIKDEEDSSIKEEKNEQSWNGFNGACYGWGYLFN